MFEAAVDVGEEELAACADGLVASIRETRLVAAQRLARVVRWADLHAPARGKAGFTPGGDGSPAVTPFAATELGCLLQTTTTSARSLLADGLDLRHRHPRLWQAVLECEVEDFKARHVARLTRAAALSAEQARQVDADVVDAVVGLPWGRAMTVVEAAIIRADPGGHERRRAEAAQRRYVARGNRDTDGMGTLITHTDVGDIARLDAMATRFAEILAARGDTDELQVRRAKAMAILADPARACLLLAQHGTSTDFETNGETTQAAAESAGEMATADAGATIDAPVDAAGELGRLLLAQGATALARLRPRTVLYLHLSADAVRTREGVGRVEGLGPVALADLHQLLGRDAVVVRPVIDHAGQVPVDCYEAPTVMREAMGIRHPYEIFPWGTLPSRGADQDHTIPYRPPDHGGPPGQTRPGNLGPLSRGHHNAKTHGGFALHQPEPGIYLWRTPAGHWYQVDAAGTTALGRGLRAPVRRPVDLARSALEVHLAGLMTA